MSSTENFDFESSDSYGTCNLTVNGKLQILEFIGEKKDILIKGKFKGVSVTNKIKESTWKEVLLKCQAEGLLVDKDVKYLRDVLWGANLKNHTKRKFDENQKTGGKGGRKAIMTEIDRKVMEIIGPDSPIFCSLNVMDSSLEQTGKVQVHRSVDNEDSPTSADPTSQTNTEKPGLKRKLRCKENESRKKFLAENRVLRKLPPKNEEVEVEHEQFEYEKMKKHLALKCLQLDVQKRETDLELGMYKQKLEIQKLEHELGLGYSRVNLIDDESGLIPVMIVDKNTSSC